ncbi:MAG: Rpn family recombination-promoting nuclease/putative transposase [Desulfamplus sp.]|nr:Rpn family recombination-promoting nuclease/putative transposase [Desulfamplus sp.]
MGHHDRFFKQIFLNRDHVVDFVQNTLPSEIKKGIDYSTILLEKGSHVDSTLAEYFSDIVYSCKFYGTNLKIALLFEHKSSPELDLPFQLHRYIANLWENSVKQKKHRMPVIPIVVYHGKENWNPDSLRSCFKDLPEILTPFIPDFKYIFINISSWSDTEIKDAMFSLASLKISMLIMKHIFDQKRLENHLAEFLEIGRSFFQEKRGIKFLKTVISYLFKATEIKTDTVVRSILSITKEGGEIAMTTAEKLREEGWQKGRQEGWQKGREEAGYSMLQKLVHNAKKQGFSEDIIATIVNLDIPSVKKILNNEKIEIPWHLLEPVDKDK